MPRIKKKDYNSACALLAAAGSRTAAKAHVIHDAKDVPGHWGVTMLANASNDPGVAGAPIIANAADIMGIEFG